MVWAAGVAATPLLPPGPCIAMSRPAQHGRGVPVLRNWILGFLATTLWITNYVVYFARDIRAWYRQGRRPRFAGLHLPERSVTGPLPPDEMQPFPPPPPPPPPVRDAEIVPAPAPGRSRPPGSPR
jgi:hypothetical protein